MTGPLLTVRDLRSYLATGQGVVRAVDGVSFTVGEAEVLGIVGESGSGKSVTCRTIVGLPPAGAAAHTSGEVIYHPRGDRSILHARPQELQSLRGSQLAMIFQDPMTALNPVLTIGDQLTEAVTAHARLPAAQARERAVGLLRRVGIPAPEQRMRDYPFQFSGGMLQRAMIAIALASSPRLLLADEPTTSLDVIIQDQILSLLLDLQQDTGMSMILVSHDLAVISEVCDRIIVMYAGQVVEEGPAAEVITRPRHPYTQALLDAVPQGDRRGQLRSIPGSPPSLMDVPAGCRFAPRCRYAVAECLTWETELIETTGHNQRARCWRHDTIERAPEWQESDSA
ncbi:MAG: ABC transporter ATP-binding protein [Actinobacteria bacterium]|nr:ABC transporter ATP-binding protein [Actinomycetota bacterium]MBO0788384.1 ABC transporter ATP-binding protein [Actinomycetota bacterium]